MIFCVKLFFLVLQGPVWLVDQNLEYHYFTCSSLFGEEQQHMMLTLDSNLLKYSI